MRQFFRAGAILALGATGYLYDGPDFESWRQVARVQALPKVFGATPRAVEGCEVKEATMPRLSPPHMEFTTDAPYGPGDSLRDALLEGVERLIASAIPGAVRRLSDPRNDEVPTARPPLNPDPMDYRKNQDDFSTLAALRTLSAGLDCATAYDSYFGGQLIPGELLIRSSDKGFGHCLCEGLNYGVANNDKLWQICTLWDRMVNRLSCKSSSSSEYCAARLPPADDSRMFTHNHCSTMTDPTFDVPLAPFDDGRVSENGVVRRDLSLVLLAPDEGVSYYFLAKALAAAHAIASNEVCGHVLAAPEQLIPGWNTTLVVEFLEEGDVLLATAAMPSAAYATVVERNGDVIVLLRAAFTELEHRLHFTNEQVGHLVEDNEIIFNDLKGTHSGFAAAAAVIIPASKRSSCSTCPPQAPR
eukprot:Polyplicarium_translucidae@DN3267_c0_g1_i12.p1